jgi:flavorubredoxin
MDSPWMLEPRPVAAHTEALASYIPVPGFGMLPVNAFLIRATQPVLVDTGLASLRQDFMDGLRSIIAPEEIRWIWITHTDPDHLGNLATVLAAAPNAQVVTTFLGMAKMSLHGLPIERVYLLNPGQDLDVGDRRLLSVIPPSFDAPETTGIYDTRTQILFSADCFGALMDGPADTAADMAADSLREGLVTWSTVDAPWLSMVDEGAFKRSLDRVRRLAPRAVLSSHLPPAIGLTEELLEHLAAAPGAGPFIGPDQAALTQMMAAGA